MSSSSPKIPLPQATAACTAFAAFAVSIFVGASADNPTSTVIGRALIAMAGGFALGFAVGLVCDWLVREEIGRIERTLSEDAAGSAHAVRRNRAGSAEAAVDLEGLTGVDVLDENGELLDSVEPVSNDRLVAAGR